MATGTELPRLMLVTDRRRTRGRSLVPIVAEAVRGGVGLVQIRERDLPDDELRAMVQRIRASVPPETRLVVNSSRRVARTMRTGLHLPASEPPEPPAERAHYALLGRSAHDEAEARVGMEEDASYLIVGTVYPTASKPGRPAGGPALIERIRRQVGPMPVYAIGGIAVTTIPALIHAGAHGVAVCGAILQANDPRRVSQAMALALEVARGTEASG